MLLHFLANRMFDMQPNFLTSLVINVINKEEDFNKFIPEFPDLLSWSSSTQNYLYFSVMVYYHQIHVED